MAMKKKLKPKFETHLLSKDELTALAALRAGDHIENYRFRKSNTIVESAEMRLCLDSRTDLYNNAESKWENRNSLMAAPHGSEMYLQSDGDPATLLGSTRYYFDELSDKTPVDAKTKFPYSQDAHYAAKILTQVYRKRVQLRQFSAIQTQRVYRGYVTRREVSKYVATRLNAMLVIYRFCKKILRKLHKIKRKEIERRNRARAIQRLGRQYLSRKQTHMVDEIRVYLIVKRIQRFLRKRLKERRIARGIKRRQDLHSTRLCSWSRGCLGRMRVHRIHSARFFIMYYWRRYFRRRHMRFIKNVQRLYRSYKLGEAVRCIQGNTRMFLIRRKYIKNHLECAAKERQRFTGELDLLVGVIRRNILVNRESRRINSWSWWNAPILSSAEEAVEQSKRKAKEDAATEAAAIAAEEQKKLPKATPDEVDAEREQVPDFIPDFPRGRSQIRCMQEEFSTMRARCLEILFTESARGELPTQPKDEDDKDWDEEAAAALATASKSTETKSKTTKGKNGKAASPVPMKGKLSLNREPPKAATPAKSNSPAPKPTTDKDAKAATKTTPKTTPKGTPSNSRPSSGSKSRPGSGSKSRPSSGSKSRLKSKPGARGRSPGRGKDGKAKTPVVEAAPEEDEEPPGPFVVPAQQMSTFEDRMTLAILYAFASKDNNTVIDYISLQYVLRLGYLQLRTYDPHPPLQFPLYEKPTPPTPPAPEAPEVEDEGEDRDQGGDEEAPTVTGEVPKTAVCADADAGVEADNSVSTSKKHQITPGAAVTASPKLKETRFPENPDPSENPPKHKKATKPHHKHQASHGLSVLTYELMNKEAINAAVTPNEEMVEREYHDHPHPASKSSEIVSDKVDSKGNMFGAILDSVRPMGVISVSSLSLVLKPSRSLYFRVFIQRSLPHYLLVQALFVRLWSYNMSNQLFDALTSYRSSHPPRYHCQRCQQPFAFRTEMVHHKPERCYHPFSHWRWIKHSHLSTNDEIVDQLVRYGKHIVDFPPCFAELDAIIKREELADAQAENAQPLTKGKSDKDKDKGKGGSSKGISGKGGSSKSPSGKGRSSKDKIDAGSIKSPGKEKDSAKSKKVGSSKEKEKEKGTKASTTKGKKK